MEYFKPNMLIHADTRDIHEWIFHKAQNAIKIGYIKAWEVLREDYQ